MALALIIFGIAIIIAIIFILIYNNVITLNNRVENAFHQIDVQLKKRADLVPNLIETVKGYAKHEKEVLENVTKARTSFMNAKSIQGKAEAANMLTGALKSLFAVAENYPNLKASQNFLSLQEDLTGIENKIAFARQFYNDSILEYNNAIQVFPNNLIAGIMNFKKKDYFEIETTERKPVKVSF